MALIFNYNSSNNTYTIGAGSSYVGSLNIPPTYGENESPVVGIANNAFNGSTTLTSLIIPSSVTSIGNSAFANCTNLASVNASNSNVTYMGGQSFINCANLVTISFPAFATSPPYVLWEGQNFKNCPKLTTINISNGITAINYETFSGCTLLNNVTIPETVTSIIANAFANCNALSSITIPSAVQTIGDNTFAGCRNLLSVNFSPNSNLVSVGYQCFLFCVKLVSVNFNSLTTLGSFAFWYCGKLETVTLPNNLESIPQWAFEYCTSLKNFTFPNALKSIGQKAFAATGIIAANIPNAVTSIGDGAFEGCSGLITANIPTSITSLGSRVFANCNNLISNMVFPAVITEIPDIIMHGCAKASFTLPSTLTRIGNYSFLGMNAITSVTLPNSVKIIGHSAFAFCSNLASINLNNVTDIYNATFRNTKLTSIDLSSITRINYESFQSCTALTSVTIGSSCISIQPIAFSNCTNLANVTFLSPSNLSFIGNNAFASSAISTISIPNSVNTMQDGIFASCRNLSTVTLPNTLIEIPSNTFSNCINLKSFTITSNIQKIGNSAFQSSGLENITIPFTLKYIADYGFPNCANLSTVTIQNNDIIFGSNVFFNSNIVLLVYKNFTLSVLNGQGSIIAYSLPDESLNIPVDLMSIPIKSIGNSAFKDNSNLKTITFSASITSIKDFAFQNCSNLLKINIPHSVTSIGKSAFNNCTSLSEITLPKALTSIDTNAFDGCFNFSSIIIYQKVTNIKDSAFANCTNLKDIYFYGNPPICGTNVFNNINSNKYFYYFQIKSAAWTSRDSQLNPISLIIYSLNQASPVTSSNKTKKSFSSSLQNLSYINILKSKKYKVLSASNYSLSTIFNPALFNIGDIIFLYSNGSDTQQFATFTKSAGSIWLNSGGSNSNSYAVPQNCFFGFQTFKTNNIMLGGGAVIQKHPSGNFITSEFLPSDEDAKRYVIAVQNADSERLENSVKDAINELVLGLKTDGLWSSIKDSCLFVGPRTLEGALVPLAGTVPTNYGFIDFDYDRKLGIKCADNKLLKTNTNGSSYPKDNIHVAVFATEKFSRTRTQNLIYQNSSTGGTFLYIISSGYSARLRNSFAAISTWPTGTNLTIGGLIGLSRKDNTGFTYSYDEIYTFKNNISSSFIATGDFYLFGRGVNTSPYNNARIGFYSLGESLDLAKLEARLKIYFAQIKSFLTTTTTT